MSKNIQIPTSLLKDVYLLLEALEAYELDLDTQITKERVRVAINAKLDAMGKRRAFTEYKTALVGSDERETKRKEYLAKAEIHENWCSEREIPSC